VCHRLQYWVCHVNRQQFVDDHLQALGIAPESTYELLGEKFREQRILRQCKRTIFFYLGIRKERSLPTDIPMEFNVGLSVRQKLTIMIKILAVARETPASNTFDAIKTWTNPCRNFSNPLSLSLFVIDPEI
jgi:hypothetical protein